MRPKKTADIDLIKPQESNEFDFGIVICGVLQPDFVFKAFIHGASYKWFRKVSVGGGVV